MNTSLAEARNPDEVVLPNYASFIDFVSDDVIKRVLFKLSRQQPVDKEDEEKLIKWV